MALALACIEVQELQVSSGQIQWLLRAWGLLMARAVVDGHACCNECSFCSPFLPLSLAQLLILSFLPELFALPTTTFKFS